MQKHGKNQLPRMSEVPAKIVAAVTPQTFDETITSGFMYELKTLALLPAFGLAFSNAWQSLYAGNYEIVPGMTIMAIMQGAIAVYNWRTFDSGQLLGRLLMDALTIGAITAYRYYYHLPALSEDRPRSWDDALNKASAVMGLVTTLRAGAFVFLFLVQTVV